VSDVPLVFFEAQTVTACSSTLSSKGSRGGGVFDKVHASSERIFQFRGHGKKIHHAPIRLHIDDQVDVAVWSCLTSGDRAEDAHPDCLLGDRKMVSVLARPAVPPAPAVARPTEPG